jgi:WD40 repeat protein
MVQETGNVTRPAIGAGWERATARILDGNGRPAGAAFLIPGNLVLTCAHVVAAVLGLPEKRPLPADAQVTLDFPLATRLPAAAAAVVFSMPVAADNTGDIAVLRLVESPPPDALPLRVIAADDLAGHRWRAFGYPRYRVGGQTKDAGIWTSGTISGREGTGWWQLAVDPEEAFSLAEGFSGAAVWDEDYAGVVGVIVAVEADPRRRVGYALTVEAVAREWPDLRTHLLAGCPYHSLRPFTELDSGVFFGRRNETERLAELVTVESRAIVPVLGPSGVGKSSLVGAGLLARLVGENGGYLAARVPHGLRHQAGELLAWALASAGQLPSGPDAQSIGEPSGHSAGQSAGSPAGPPVDPPAGYGPSWQARWRAITASITDGNDPAEVAEQILADWAEGTRLMIVVDQFEELVSAAPDVAQELDALLGALTRRWPDGTRRVQAVVVSRIDFLQQLEAFPHITEAWKTTNVVVPPMTREQLRETITRPLSNLKGIRFAAGLPEQILHDTPAGPSALPMLEYALTELWKRQERGIITTEAYRDIGGVEGALARSAERALWQRVDESERPDVERVLIQMVRPGEQLDAGGRAPDTRRVASHDEFGDQEWRLIHRLASTRLVTITRQPTGPDTAELAHEALLGAWPRLARWVDANRAFRTWQEELRRSMRQWHDHRQDARFVLDEPHIADALEWQRLRPADLTQAERAFIKVSVAAADRRRRRRRYRFGVVTLVTAIALAAGGYGVQQRENGDIQHRNSLSQQVASEAEGLDASQPNLAKQLRIAAYDVAHTPQAYSSLFSASGLAGTISLAGVTDAVFSPDGRLLALAAGQQVRLWDRADQRVTAVVPAAGGASGAAFDATGHLLAVAEGNGTTELWNVSSPGHPISVASLTGPAGPVEQVAFSGRGHLLAAAGWDHHVRVWDVSHPGRPDRLATLPAGSNVASSVTFSADGRLLASGDWDGTVHIWNVAGRGPPTVLSMVNDGQKVRTIAFDSAQHLLAAGGDTGTASSVHLWSVSDPAAPRRVATIPGSESTVSALVFSPVAPVLAATGAFPGQTDLWNVANPAKPAELPLLTGGSQSVAFSPDGNILATLDQDVRATRAPDNEVQLWDVASPEEPAAAATTNVPDVSSLGVAVSADGRLLAVTGTLIGSSSRTVLWNIANPRNPVALSGLKGPTGSVTLARHGRRQLLAVAGEGAVALWDVTDPARPSFLGQAVISHPKDPEGDITVALSPDGEVLAALGTGDRVIRLWSLKILSHVKAMRDLPNAPQGPLSLGDGGRILTDTAGGAQFGEPSHTLLWMLAGPQGPRQVTQLASAVGGSTASAVDPVAPILATGGADGVIRLWTIPSSGQPSPLATLSGTTASPATLAFSPDGHTLASADSDGNIHLWDVSNAQAPITMGNFAMPSGGSNLISVSRSAGSTTGQAVAAVGAQAAGQFAEITAGAGTGNAEHTVIENWAIGAAALIGRVCAGSGDPITPAQWNQYIPGQPYRPPCAAAG